MLVKPGCVVAEIALQEGCYLPLTSECLEILTCGPKFCQTFLLVAFGVARHLLSILPTQAMW